jgi:hypothetical protein
MVEEGNPVGVGRLDETDILVEALRQVEVLSRYECLDFNCPQIRQGFSFSTTYRVGTPNASSSNVSSLKTMRRIFCEWVRWVGS